VSPVGGGVLILHAAVVALVYGGLRARLRYSSHYDGRGHGCGGGRDPGHRCGKPAAPPEPHVEPEPSLGPLKRPVLRGFRSRGHRRLVTNQDICIKFTSMWHRRSERLRRLRMCLIAGAGVLVLGGAVVVPASGAGSTASAAAVSIGQTDSISPVGSRPAAKQRQESDPELVPYAEQSLAEQDERPAVPDDKYAMAGGCYAIEDVASGRW